MASDCQRSKWWPSKARGCETTSPSASGRQLEWCRTIIRKLYVGHRTVPLLMLLSFPFSALTLLVARQEGYPVCRKTGCWFVGGDGLTRALHVLQLQLSPPPSLPLAPTKSIVETYWLTQVHLQNGRYNVERNSATSNVLSWGLKVTKTLHLRYLINDAW